LYLHRVSKIVLFRHHETDEITQEVWLWRGFDDASSLFDFKAMETVAVISGCLELQMMKEELNAYVRMFNVHISNCHSGTSRMLINVLTLAKMAISVPKPAQQSTTSLKMTNRTDPPYRIC